MSLTYQPFAQAAEIKELREELEMNLPGGERIGSMLLGALVLAATVSPKRTGKWYFLTISVTLMWRGWTGRCPWYRRIGLDRRHGI